MYAEIKEKLHASNLKLFGVYAYLLIHRNWGFYDFVFFKQIL